MEKLQIAYRKVAELIPYAKNPRKNDNAVDAVAESIKQFGFKIPIIIDGNDEIIAGHTRLKAAKKLGIVEVPTIMADDLTPEQARAFRLVDNKVGEIAEWDMNLLADELIGLDFGGFDFGFGNNDESVAEVVDDEYDGVPPEEPKTKRGDVYQLGRHRLMCGDSTSAEDVQLLAGGGTDGYASYRSSLWC